MMMILDFIKDNYLIALETLGAVAIAARFTPNKADDYFLNILAKLVNTIGMNHGTAANKER